jgi:hypothetical protein
VLVHDSLQPPEESVALRPKPASRSLLVHETPYSETGAAQLWGLSPDYLDRIDPRSGRVLASIQLEAEQVALSPFNQTLVTHRDGVLRAWQHPDYSGSLTDLEEIEGFHPESRLTVLSEAEVTGAGVERIAFLDPNTLLVETGDGLYLYDANPLRPRHRLTQTKPFAVQQMGEFLIAAFVDEARDRLEFRTYWGPEFEMSEPVFLDRVEPDNLAVVDFDRGGDWIWIGTKDGRVLLADLGRDMEAYGSLLDAVSEIGAPEDDTLLDNSAVMEVFQLEGGAIEGLHTGGNRLAIVTEDGTLRICQISPEGKGTLQFTLYPFPSSIPDQLVFLSPGGSESSERILLKNGSGGLFSLALGRDDRFQTEADHRFGMGRGANTGDFIVYPRGTSIEARSIQPGSTSTRLQPGRDNVGEGGFNALVTNPSMNRFVSYSNGRLFTWSKEGGRFLSEPFTQTLVSGIFGSSMRFIDDHHLVVGSPGAGSPVIMLVRYEADGKDASVQFSAPLGEIRIQGDPGSSGSPDTLTNLAPRYVAGNADFLFFGDDKADEVWQIDMKARTAKRLRLASPPRRLEVVGEGRDILAVSHEGYVSLHQAGSLEPRGRVDFPLIGIEGEDFYIREMLAIPGTDFFLSGYKGSIQLVNAAKAERIRDFPVNGYVWSIHLAPDQSAIHYISEIGQGTIPFSDLGQDPGRYGGFRKKGQSRTGQTTLFSNQPRYAFMSNRAFPRAFAALLCFHQLALFGQELAEPEGLAGVLISPASFQGNPEPMEYVRLHQARETVDLVARLKGYQPVRDLFLEEPKLDYEPFDSRTLVYRLPVETSHFVFQYEAGDLDWGFRHFHLLWEEDFYLEEPDYVDFAWELENRDADFDPIDLKRSIRPWAPVAEALQWDRSLLEAHFTLTAGDSPEALLAQDFSNAPFWERLVLMNRSLLGAFAPEEGDSGMGARHLVNLIRLHFLQAVYLSALDQVQSARHLGRSLLFADILLTANPESVFAGALFEEVSALAHRFSEETRLGPSHAPLLPEAAMLVAYEEQPLDLASEEYPAISGLFDYAVRIASRSERTGKPQAINTYLTRNITVNTIEALVMSQKDYGPPTMSFDGNMAVTNVGDSFYRQLNRTLTEVGIAILLETLGENPEAYLGKPPSKKSLVNPPRTPSRGGISRPSPPSNCVSGKPPVSWTPPWFTSPMMSSGISGIPTFT